MTQKFIVRRMPTNGVRSLVSYYTGRAGMAYISFKKEDAFKYDSSEAAQAKATMFQSLLGSECRWDVISVDSTEP